MLIAYPGTFSGLPVFPSDGYCHEFHRQWRPLDNHITLGFWIHQTIPYLQERSISGVVRITWYSPLLVEAFMSSSVVSNWSLAVTWIAFVPQAFKNPLDLSLAQTTDSLQLWLTKLNNCLWWCQTIEVDIGNRTTCQSQ